MAVSLSLPDFHDDEVRVLIVGIRGQSRFSAADLLSGRKDGGQEDREIVKTPVITDEGRRMMLVTGPNLCEEDTARQTFTTALSLLSPGPHAVLIVLNLEDQQSQQCDIVKRAQELLGAEVLQYCIVLLHQNHQEHFTGASREMINTCGGRFHVMGDSEPKPAQTAALVAEIDKLVQFRASHDEALRILIVGIRGQSRFSAADLLSGRKDGGQEDREIVKTPVITDEGRRMMLVTGPNLCEEDTTRQTFTTALSLLFPGPHAVLLVLNLEDQQSQQCDIVKRAQELLEEEVLQYCTVLLLQNHQEHFTEASRGIAGEIINTCGGRFHIISSSDRKPAQTAALVAEIDKLYDEINQDKTQLALYADSASRDDEMRILIVGIRGQSRFSAADLLSGREDGGQVDREIVKTPVITDEGRRMMLVTGPNLCEEDTTGQTFTTALSLSSPGPHAVLIVLNLEDQQSQQCDIVKRTQELLGAEVLQYCIVLLHQNHQEHFTGASREMINACGGRFHIISDSKPKPAQAAALVAEIDKLYDEINQDKTQLALYADSASRDDEVRILIVGIRGQSRFSVADLLSGRTDGGQEDREIVKTPVITDEGRRMMLVTGPNLCEDDTARQTFTTALLLLSPGPHTVLMVLNLEDQQSKQCDIVKRAQELLGAEVLQYCIFLLHQNHQEHFTGASREMINACGGRFHIIRDSEPKPVQAAALVAEIDKLKMKLTRIETKRILTVILAFHMTSIHVDASHDEALRILIVGIRGQSRFSAADLLSGRKDGGQEDREIVKTPVITDEGRMMLVTGPNLCEEDTARQTFTTALFLSSPGPHAVLMVLENQQSQQCDIVKRAQELLGEEVLQYCIVLLLQNHQEHLTGASREMINACGGRFHVMGDSKPKPAEKAALLAEVDKITFRTDPGNSDQHKDVVRCAHSMQCGSWRHARGYFNHSVLHFVQSKE
ncbi:GTPase IMAP family member 6-like protein [Labeo rohita]|uniref:GTPase IMAP family member 6-like protein n=1 Tax=Labeo rohita TaxID=84645 RepID=A0A498NTQ0_LABRO|nr:GTPase IMAP family member 6-like protein [Labeo rohita]